MKAQTVIYHATIVTLALLTLTLEPCLSSAQPMLSGATEFAGPFASWRQITCDGVDDTDLLQSELDVLGLPGHSPVLYINPGVCRISQTLRLGHVRGAARGKENITLLGADPATTTIQWAGPPNAAMLAINGVGHSRYGRLTWDGGGTASSVYGLEWDGQTDFFPTGNRHEYEVFRNLEPTRGVAIRAGTAGFGEAETEVIGCQFSGPYLAGILLYNYNVLDWWVWDSEFHGLGYGITNYVDGTPPGAGGYSVNRSNFLDTSIDMGLANTNFFSSRWNYSRNSNWHVYGAPIGNAPSPWTSQAEVIIDPRKLAFQLGSAGPLGLLDTAIRGPGAQVNVTEGYSDTPQGDVWSLGSMFSSAAPYADRQAPYRRRSYDDQYEQVIADPGPRAVPNVPRESSAPVIEVEGGNIGAALAAAGDQRAIVHIPAGDYKIAQTLVVGPNVILQGDGFGATRLLGAGADPIVHLAGPSHAVLGNFGLHGTERETGILVDGPGVDTPDGVVHVEQWMSSNNRVGLRASDLTNTVVNLLDHLGSTNMLADFQVRNATVHVFNGAGSNSGTIYDLRSGEIVSQSMYYESGSKTDFVAPGSSGTLILDDGKIQARSLDTRQFGEAGLPSLVDIGTADAVQATFGPHMLALGFVYGWQTAGQPLPPEPSFSGGPFALWLARSNAGGGSVMRDERAATNADEQTYVQDHLVALRRAVPRPLGGRASDVEEVVLTRVGGDHLATGFSVQGADAPQ